MAKKFGGQPTRGTKGITNSGDPEGRSGSMSRDDGWQSPTRNPHAVTDTHSTAPVPSTGTMQSAAGSHAGAGGRGSSSSRAVTDTHTESAAPQTRSVGKRASNPDDI